MIAPSRQGLEFASRIYILENGGLVGHDLPFDISITGRDEHATALPVDAADTPRNVEHGAGRCRAAAHQLYSRPRTRFFPFGHTFRIGQEGKQGQAESGHGQTLFLSVATSPPPTTMGCTSSLLNTIHKC